jgi:putative ATP-dependent endonuclease of the OLD family
VQIRRVTVRNFRGIREATWWLPDRRFMCLVGAGDSTKTTLLDAIQLVLGSHRNATFNDIDFYNCDISRKILLQVLLGDLHEALMAENAFGLELCGLTADRQLVHDPHDGAEACVLLQLTVDENLEPEWTIVRPGTQDEGQPLTAGRRRALGLFRVDDRVDSHLRWGRGSALLRLTEPPAAARAVILARRQARQAVAEAPDSALHTTAKQVAEAARAIGSAPYKTLQPGWDPTADTATGALVLQDGTIPLTAAGLGTRRLTSIAAQQAAAIRGDIVLIDEIEHGLEPHRLQHVLYRVRHSTADGQGQVIVTTHSPVAVQALQAADISVVRSVGGETTAQQVPDALDEVQGAMRACPAAVLSRRAVVCEGKTEVGIARHLIRYWDGERIVAGQPTHAALGACLVDGVGRTAPTRAGVFQDLGIPALLFCDNDDPAIDADVAAVSARGVSVVRWQPGNSTEAEIALTLETEQLRDVLLLAAELNAADQVRDAVVQRLSRIAPPGDLDPGAWTEAGHSLDEIRSAVAEAAKKKEWFKREDKGEALGNFITERWDHFALTDVGNRLAELRAFLYEDEERDDQD